MPKRMTGRKPGAWPTLFPQQHPEKKLKAIPEPLPDEFTLAFAVVARDGQDLDQRERIPSGTDIIVTRRFDETERGHQVVEFTFADPDAGQLGKFYRAFADQLLPVGSPKAQQMLYERARRGVTQ